MDRRFMPHGMFLRSCEMKNERMKWLQWKTGSKVQRCCGFRRDSGHETRPWATPENREIKKWKFSFFRQRHALLASFDIFVVTYRVTNFLPKLLLFSTEKKKLNFHLWFSPIFGLCPDHAGVITWKRLPEWNVHPVWFLGSQHCNSVAIDNWVTAIKLPLPRGGRGDQKDFRGQMTTPPPRKTMMCRACEKWVSLPLWFCSLETQTSK